jgi:hypothetical protein
MRSEASDDPLLKHCPAEPMVFHWHGDTFDLPKGAVLLASSEKYPHQAFRFGKKAWGLQFHMEITEPMIKEWIDEVERKSKAPSLEWNACKILTDTPCYLPEMEAWAGKVFRDFISLTKSDSAC